jgi:pimeloyl-ACP methyl ester carboxylesterase
MLWLPGAYHSHQDFVTAGFAAAARARHLDIDLVFIDLEMDYIGDRSILARLRRDFVLPARAAGVELWLGGISLGGLFALDYVDSHPGDVDGLCLLAPYLGNRMLTGEIAAAQGLAAWQPGNLADDDVERRIWRWLKTRGADDLALHLGYGRGDRFAGAHELMAAALPTTTVDAIEGSHDWATWRRLWENFLDSRRA